MLLFALDKAMKLCQSYVLMLLIILNKAIKLY